MEKIQNDGRCAKSKIECLPAPTLRLYYTEQAVRENNNNDNNNGQIRGCSGMLNLANKFRFDVL